MKLTPRFGFVRILLCICMVVAAWLLFPRRGVQPVFVSQNATPEAAPQVEKMEAQPVSATVVETFPAVSSDDSNEKLLQIARDAVARSAQQAIAWAQSQTDAALRERLLFAVVQAWGEADPRAAVAWAQIQDEDGRQSRMEAALTGAATQPEVALQVGHDLLASVDDETGDAYGATLVGALGRSGKFDAAMRFLDEAPADSRESWAGITFNLWAQTMPEDAAKALETITDADTHAAAFDALVAGWATSSPDTLADYAVKLSSERDREQALNAALKNWCLQNPAAMTDWMNQLPPCPALDAATALMVAQTDSVNRSPEIAMTWVAGITDAKLREESLLHVANEWAQSDPAAAQKYVENATWIGADQRAEVLKNLQTQ